MTLAFIAPEVPAWKRHELRLRFFQLESVEGATKRLFANVAWVEDVHAVERERGAA